MSIFPLFDFLPLCGQTKFMQVLQDFYYYYCYYYYLDLSEFFTLPLADGLSRKSERQQFS